MWRAIQAGVKSTQTTVVAILSVVIVILTAIVNMLDADPSTVADWNKVALSIWAMLQSYGWLVARDAAKSSQDSGVRK